MAQAGVHHRAMAAWRSISHQTQLLWNVLEFVSGAADGADLRLTFRCFVCGVDHPERYRVLMRMHLTSPGGCINPGKMRNFLALQNCPAPGGVIDFVIPDYKQSSRLNLPRYQINCRHRLLDTVTGYRNQLIQESFQFDLL